MGGLTVSVMAYDDGNDNIDDDDDNGVQPYRSWR